MKVGAYLRAQLPGYPIEAEVLEMAALSPLEAKPQAMRALSLEDSVEENISDAKFSDSLKYALSTLYYLISGSVSGGSRSEKVGDTTLSVSGYVLTAEERRRLRATADLLRRELKKQVMIQTEEGRGMFDATALRKR